MVDVAFLGIFYIVFLVGMIVLYFTNLVKSDIWLQGIILMFILTVFINMIPFVLYQTNLDNDHPDFINRVVVGDADIDETNVITEFLTESDNYHLFKFEFDIKDEERFESVNFCFRYNNSDEDNFVHVTNQLTDISEEIYINNNTVGTYCIFINETWVRNGYFLGLHCGDCSVSNQFGLVVVNSSQRVEEVEVNITASPQGNIYSIEEDFVHLFWIETVSLPVKGVINNFWRLLFFIGIFALIFIMRLIYVITAHGVDYDD